MSREPVPYVVVGQPRLTLGTAVALPFLGKSEIVSQSRIWAVPGVTLDMVEYSLDDGPTLKKVEGCGSIEGRDLFLHPLDMHQAHDVQQAVRLLCGALIEHYGIEGRPPWRSPHSRASRPRKRCWSTWPGSNGSISSAAPIWATPISWSASARADTVARRCTARSPRPTSWPSPRRSATIAAARARMVRSTWARTRTRCPARRSARRWKFWRPTAWRRSSSATTA